MYYRDLQTKVTDWLNEKEILIIYGARQVGKTTLLENIFSDYSRAIILNCERPAINETLGSMDIGRIKSILGDNKIIALDEAQSITNIGKILKLIYDDKSLNYKLIATGSSSFDLANKIVEPLTGRNIKFRLFALSLNEIQNNHDWIWILENIENLMLYGFYPGIIDLDTIKKRTKLEELAADYLYKDILIHERIKNPGLLRVLLKSLALQVGQTVSINELSNHMNISSQTVERYLDLLEKAFVIFSLNPFSRNIRNEMKKNKKIYFYDTGIRNAIIGNFSPLENRQDVGALWENFCVADKIKYNSTMGIQNKFYYWRTYDGAELDLIEEKEGSLSVYEFKWSPRKKTKIPNSFAEKYDVSSFKVINKNNLSELHF
ncbi:MAG: ATP-binding protein [Bacteroidales bacterium]|nr:ATP-binding protein [Bacteroidales bacterium]